ncbi:glycosyltransferase family 9 protein [Nocardia sp. NPDC004068]|uniref:glycosyltransferase family 9 protein n=1 Tax=Nocardia sp. NPDC004068 TaxID=3364303 RepID=UPI0036B9A8EC
MAVTLALRALGLGDFLTAVPALRALRTARPEHRLVLAAPEWLRPIIELSGAVDELLPTPGLGALRWPGPRPALAVNLHGRGPESIGDLLALRPRHLITHRHARYPGVDGPEWAYGTHEVTRWCRLLEFAGITSSPGALGIPAPPETEYDGRILVHPGASTAACRWPADRFATVAAALRRAGHRVLITGSADEYDLAREVAHHAGLPETAVTAGRYTLRELAAAVAGAALVISGDTGIGHLATALGTPSVLVFGPNPPSWWGPPPDRPEHRALWSGQLGDPFADTPDPGLLLISTDEVLDAAKDQLAVLLPIPR